MEPPDLNSSGAREESQLDAWLRQPTAPLADDGFSARVLAALPPHSPSRIYAVTRPSWHGFVFSAFAITATTIALAAFGPEIARDIAETASAAPIATNGALDNHFLWLALAVAAGSLLYALRPDPRRWLRG